MTISYQDQFFRLLLRWRGSLWRSIWKDLLVFLTLYFIINFIFRFALTEPRQHEFMKYIALFKDYIQQIPLTFLLGFYVGMVIKRWWEQFQHIAYPDDLLYWVSGLLRGNGPEELGLRRQIARYTLLSSVLAWRSISERVLRRFPTEKHIVSSGLMTEAEFQMYSSIHVATDPHYKWFIPINWIQSILVRAFEEGRLSHTNELRSLFEKLEKFRDKFFQLFLYDWVPIPLVYTQVATITVYGYFAFCLLGRQYPMDTSKGQQSPATTVDIYIPLFTILQFLFYIGWLKVGEDLMFPFGSDDEDFELNYVLDRNLEMSYLIVDQLHLQSPPEYGDNDAVPQLPHTKASVDLDYHPQYCHTRDIKFTPNELEIVGAKPNLLHEYSHIYEAPCTSCPPFSSSHGSSSSTAELVSGRYRSSFNRSSNRLLSRCCCCRPKVGIQKEDKDDSQQQPQPQPQQHGEQQQPGPIQNRQNRRITTASTTTATANSLSSNNSFHSTTAHISNNVTHNNGHLPSISATVAVPNGTTNSSGAGALRHRPYNSDQLLQNATDMMMNASPSDDSSPTRSLRRSLPPLEIPPRHTTRSPRNAAEVRSPQSPPAPAAEFPPVSSAPRQLQASTYDNLTTNSSS